MDIHIGYNELTHMLAFLIGAIVGLFITAYIIFINRSK